TARLYATDMTTLKTYMLYSSANIDSGGWNYIGMSWYNNVWYIWLSTTLSKTTTEKFQHVVLTFSKGNLGKVPVATFQHKFENDQLMDSAGNPDSTYGSTIYYAPCEEGVAAGTYGAGQGRHIHFGIIFRGDLYTYGAPLTAPSRFYSSDDPSWVIQIDTKQTDMGYAHYVNSSHSPFDNPRYFRRSTDELYRGRPALKVRDTYDGYVGDHNLISSSSTIPKNNGLVVNSSVKNVSHWSFKQNSLSGVLGPNQDPHYNEAAVCISGSTLYKFTGEVGYFIL
ncbi:hypothetical protein, partial [Brevibacillus brevis]|uniref:hypothetical protein n=1 Tax=Brevibacillus brevis TaxID=1393 RepID=UPI0037CB2216